ncbi:AraC-type DNA-binding protein [Paenibacillus sp. UNCCL117]|uniref:AraC family transcriptional regulator n=1 Tax=unclassified Paenibacillus TaxID=185978 RepID=UPI00087F5BDE|nr:MULTISPECIES: AraC family transcriptional regulator [unclassified Paenibacillus]SDD56007.1 AraC-type DNA-binding protein [Paenibacillus sp. cl123]SFW51471.1 AraC-type DNA-binding protein [Paenibacillus sp. UNCCL117]
MRVNLASIELANGAFSYSHAVTHSPHDNQHQMYLLSCYEIYYLISGSVVYQVENQTYTLSPGDLLIINNKEIHRPYFTSDTSYERILIFFTPEFCSHYNRDSSPILQYFERKKPGSFNLLPGKLVEQEQLARYFTEIEEHHRSGQPMSSLEIELTFIRLLIQLNRIIGSHLHTFAFEGDYDAKIELIIAYLNDNLHRPLTLQDIESNFFISRYHFSHLFKRITGYSFKQYMIHKRIAKAAELLKLSVPPSEVCRRTGFEDYSNFYKAFKKITGVSPANYS